MTEMKDLPKAKGQIKDEDSIDFYLPMMDKDDWGDLAELPLFGLAHLSVTEAARLIALDTFYAGKIDLKDEIKEQLEESDDLLNDPLLLDVLAEHIAMFESNLSKAVLGGWLKAYVSRDIEGNLNMARTFIDREDLIDWLHKTGHDYDDIVSEWIDRNNDAINHVGDLSVVYRGFRRQDLNSGLKKDDSPVILSLLTEISNLKKQLEHLKKQGNERIDRPVTTLQRRTMLTVIASLCNYSDIDPLARGSAQQIAKLTDDIGASVGSETISKILKEMPDAVETRKK